MADTDCEKWVGGGLITVMAPWICTQWTHTSEQLRDYQDLVEAAHQQHMKVFFDVVPNHVGPLHPWVKDPPMPDWFHGTAEHHLTSHSPIHGEFYGQAEKKQQNEPTIDLFEALVDPHTPPQMRKNLTDGWFFGVLPDMNTENPVVEQYLVQNSIWWAETSGLDGYRIDTFPYVSRAFWAQWHQELRRIYPRLSTIGEVFHPDPTVTSFFAGGRKGWDGIDTQLTTLFDFPLYFAMRDVLLNGAPAGRIANVLRQDSLYPHPEFLVPFFANHDTTRFAGAAGATADKLKLAFRIDDHDARNSRTLLWRRNRNGWRRRSGQPPGFSGWLGGR